jgi:hypothetical protein
MWCVIYECTSKHKCALIYILRYALNKLEIGKSDSGLGIYFRPPAVLHTNNDNY